MNNIPQLFQEPADQEAPRHPAAGTLYLVCYVSERDTHIQSIHREKGKAVTCAGDQAAHMRQHRLKMFTMGQPSGEVYLVIECPVVHVERV